MTNESLTYSNGFGELLGPLLLSIRNTGFFEAYVFMPVMTMLAMLLYFRLWQRVRCNEDFADASRLTKGLLGFAYFSLCFLLMNATAVAFKTLIIAELDYATWRWYIPLVAPLHFYIVSVVAVHLILIWTTQTRPWFWLLYAYVQLGLFAGFYTAVWRLLHEPFELRDITSGVGAVFMLGWFALLNWDILRRFVLQYWRLSIVGEKKATHSQLMDC